MENLQTLFDSLFKFKVHDSIRHKGDNKDYTSDMGLLVLHRELIEEVSDNDVHDYVRYYLCRVVKFSGSGDIMRFREKELMSTAEYNQKKIADEAERNAMRQEIDRIQTEVFKAFGVDRKQIIKLKAEPDKEFWVTGFQTNAETGRYELHIRQVGGLESGRKKEVVQSPDEILTEEEK